MAAMKVHRSNLLQTREQTEGPAADLLGLPPRPLGPTLLRGCMWAGTAQRGGRMQAIPAKHGLL